MPATNPPSVNDSASASSASPAGPPGGTGAGTALADTAAANAAATASAAAGHRVVACQTAELAPNLTADLFRLDNGLGVLLAYDRRAPVFAYQTWFGVGSRDEDETATGLAHLFEHLMFKGTKTHPSGTFDAEMERRGAQTNAATWVDWTHYTLALATTGNNLETVVGFEADRMHNLVLDDATFKSELEVVKNERRMAVDNSVAGQASEALFALAFAVHPYRWPTIGSMAHLERASIADLQAFYERHYAPDNATVVICGDIDAARALTLVAEAYGPLKAAGAGRRQLPAEPEQRAARAQLLVAPVQSPQVMVGYVAPPAGTRAHAALEMFVTMLAEGDAAWAYADLVTKQRKASEVSAYLTPFAQPGLVELHAVANASVTAKELLFAVRRCLARCTELVDAEALEKARNSLMFAYYDELRDVESLAEALGHAPTNTGDFAAAFKQPEMWASITADELVAVAKATFAPARENVVVAVAKPADAADLAFTVEAHR